MAFLEVLKGLAVTARHLVRKPTTFEYPESPRPVAPRFHGRHVLNRYEDGLEKCIGCELCAWACPADAIFVLGADNTELARFSPGERYALDYQINYLRCIFCGLCIEACPTRALTMINDYELADDSRKELIWTKDRLLAPLPEGSAPLPHTAEQVRARGVDYYGGFAATPSLAAVVRSGGGGSEGHGREAREGGGEPQGGGGEPQGGGGEPQGGGGEPQGGGEREE